MNRMEPSPSKLIDVKEVIRHPAVGWMARSFEATLERLLATDRLNSVYEAFQQIPKTETFFSRALRAMDIRYTLADADQDKIPAKGPLVVVANHPYGGIEGIILGDLLQRIRPDIKIMGNYLLDQIPDIRPYLITVDPFGHRSTILANAAAYKKSIRHIQNGGALIVFPAGEVAHFRLRRRCVTDSPWSSHVGRMIRHARARVLPIFFPGRNSLKFHFCGLIHPLLRTVLLPRELTNKQHRTFQLLVGQPIRWQRMMTVESTDRLVDYLRFHTDFLANRLTRKRYGSFPVKKRLPASAPPVTIAPGVPVARLRREINALPKAQCLVKSMAGDVFVAKADQIPVTLKEICRLREHTFRQVKEGTQKASDRDHYDDHYRHLFLWNHQYQEIVGAYRLGMAQKIIDRFGIKGLYTQSLFHFDPQALKLLNDAVEVGRSFIRPKYQRKHTSLTLLWRGIGQFVVQHPEIRKLFGAVSISRDYRELSRDLMVRFLARNRRDPHLAAKVTPKKPYRIFNGRLRRLERSVEAMTALRSIEDISFLVSELEKDGKGVPILIRHYLKLNARFIHFNVDRDFSNVVDGLIIVDLDTTDPRTLQRFMGKEGLRRFQADVDQRRESLQGAF